MTDSPAQPDDLDQTGATGGQSPPAGMPRWVKVFAVIGIILVVVLLVALLVGGNHGPSRHTGDPGGSTVAAIADSGDAGEPRSLGAARARG
jgi:hypothetical protein